MRWMLTASVGAQQNVVAQMLLLFELGGERLRKVEARNLVTGHHHVQWPAIVAVNRVFLATRLVQIPVDDSIGQRVPVVVDVLVVCGVLDHGYLGEKVLESAFGVVAHLVSLQLATANTDGRRVGDTREHLVGAFARRTGVILHLAVMDVGARVSELRIGAQTDLAQFAGESAIANAKVVVERANAAVLAQAFGIVVSTLIGQLVDSLVRRLGAHLNNDN